MGRERSISWIIERTVQSWVTKWKFQTQKVQWFRKEQTHKHSWRSQTIAVTLTLNLATWMLHQTVIFFLRIWTFDLESRKQNFLYGTQSSNHAQWREPKFCTFYHTNDFTQTLGQNHIMQNHLKQVRKCLGSSFGSLTFYILWVLYKWQGGGGGRGSYTSEGNGS